MHPDSDLIAYLKDELPPAERERVAGHLAMCVSCRATHDDFREVLAQLPASLGEPPAVNWGRWQAELRARLEATGSVRRPRRRWSAWAAVSLATAAGLAALVVFMGGPPGPVDLTSTEQVVLGRRLDLLEDYPVVERLELLEDLDLIGQLDRLEAGKES